MHTGLRVIRYLCCGTGALCDTGTNDIEASGSLFFCLVLLDGVTNLPCLVDIKLDSNLVM